MFIKNLQTIMNCIKSSVVFAKELSADSILDSHLFPDSLSRITFLVELENAFNVELTPDFLLEERTLSQVCADLTLRQTPTDFMARSIEYADNVAIVDREHTFTYRELAAEIKMIVDTIWAKYDITSGQRVVLAINQPSALVVAMFAVLQMEAIPVLIDPNEPNTVECSLRETKPSLIISDEDLVDVEVSEIVSILGHTVSVSKQYCDILKDETNWKKVSLVYYTSGSTGKPCGILHSRASLEYNSLQVGTALKCSSNDVFLCSVPPFHSYALCCILFPSLLFGSKLVVQFPFYPRKAAELIVGERVSHFFGVPSIFSLLLMANNIKSDFSSVRYCYSSTQKLDTSLSMHFEEKFHVPLLQEFGISETGALSLAFNTTSYNDCQSIGVPMKGVAFHISADGELLIETPGLAIGRIGEGALSSPYKSGDIAICVDGDYYIIGRKKNLLDNCGNKVFAEEIESTIKNIPGVCDAVALQVCEDTSYVIVAVSMEDSNLNSNEEILQSARDILGEGKAPKKVLMVPRIERNQVGKITKSQRDQLLALYSACSIIENPEELPA